MLACKNFADVNVALHDVVETSVVESAGSFTSEIWLEQSFRATRNVRRDSDESPSGRTSLIFIVDGANVVSSFVMCWKIHWNTVVPPDNMT